MIVVLNGGYHYVPCAVAARLDHFPPYLFLANASFLDFRDLRSILVTGAGGSAGNNVCWGLRVSNDGKKILLDGTDVDKTSIELNGWIDRAYILPSATSPR